MDGLDSQRLPVRPDRVASQSHGSRRNHPINARVGIRQKVGLEDGDCYEALIGSAMPPPYRSSIRIDANIAIAVASS